MSIWIPALTCWNDAIEKPLLLVAEIAGGIFEGALLWRLGAIFGLIFFVVFMVLTVPWVLLRS